MKKILTLLVILLGIYSAACAQTKTKAEFGFNIGYNAFSVWSLSSANVGSGFNAGVSGDYYFSDRWSIKAKLSYDQKGWNKATDIYFGDAFIQEGNFQLNYITIPLMVNWHFGKTRNWFLGLGPYAGFLMNCSESSANNNIKPQFNSTDLGLSFGIGVKFPIAEKAKLILEYDGQLGLHNIIGYSDNYSYDGLFNARSAFNIGVSFPIH